jgi:hypothetical protein
MLQTNIFIYLIFYKTILIYLSYIYRLYRFKHLRNYKFFDKKSVFVRTYYTNLQKNFTKIVYKFIEITKNCANNSIIKNNFMRLTLICKKTVQYYKLLT